MCPMSNVLAISSRMTTTEGSLSQRAYQVKAGIHDHCVIAHAPIVTFIACLYAMRDVLRSKKSAYWHTSCS